MSEPEVRRIAVATFGRSDFSILRPLCRMLHEHPRFVAGWWVGGAHFEDTSGRTVVEVERSGVPIWALIDGGEYDRSEVGTVGMMAAQMAGFGSAGSSRPGVSGGATVEVEAGSPQPDVVLILGDRFEAISAALAMVPLGIPVGHISGGSITEGAIDDVFRHCLTKIAAIHFCDLPEFARRIHFMGEDPERVITSGALGLDAFVGAPIRSVSELADHFGFAGLERGFLLATLHPESMHPETTEPMTHALIGALADSGRQVVITYPNADPGSDIIIEAIEAAAESHAHIHRCRSLGAEWYPTAMAHAGAMVGNSSGGIIEAASFGLPVVDIGERQKGRAHGANVIHCGRDRSAILAAIRTVTAPEFAERAAGGNIYGDGRGAERVVRVLGSVDPSELARPKRFADPDPAFVGELMELT